ncbi:redoxin domain-containing protein [Alteromonadaceae bacterium BrNp21-10]|nr:redoxin domain-containing protein [Alteromonadaceae bacterium BrNp21-10]
MIKVGDRIDELCLPNIDGSEFDVSQIKGKRYMLSFFRFAACPFCNLRVHQLVENASAWNDNFTIVAVFDSPLDNLQRYADRHQSPFPILADETNKYYKQFGVQRSILRTLKGFILRFPQVLNAMFVQGYWPTSFKGNLFTMPLDILVNEQGVVELVYLGKDEGDHLPLQDMLTFANKA